MVEAAKRYAELTAAERAALGKPPPAVDPPAEPPPNAHMLFSDVAATIKGWTPSQMQVFADQFGISIVHQAAKHAKKFEDMTPAEKQAFIDLHGLRNTAIAKDLKGAR